MNFGQMKQAAPVLMFVLVSIALMGLNGCGSNTADRGGVPGARSGPQATSLPEPSVSPVETDDTVSVDLDATSMANPDSPVSAGAETQTPNAGGAPLPANKTRVRGRVTDVQGNPIVGAAVTVPKGTSPVPEMARLTNENGEYSWVLDPGMYTLQVNADTYKPAQGEADTQKEKEVGLNFQMERE